MGKKERDAGPVWKYHRYSTGVSYGRYATLQCTRDWSDDIMIGRYDGPTSEGCHYEFQVALYGSFGRPVIAVRLFSDAFHAFQDFRKFFQWLHNVRPTTLEMVETWLQKNGVIDGLEKYAPRVRR